MRKMEEGDGSFSIYTLGNFLPFIFQTSALFPYKRSHSKVAHFQIYGYVSTGEESKFLTESVTKKRKTTFVGTIERHDASPIGSSLLLACVLVN